MRTTLNLSPTDASRSFLRSDSGARVLRGALALRSEEWQPAAETAPEPTTRQQRRAAERRARKKGRQSP